MAARGAKSGWGAIYTYWQTGSESNGTYLTKLDTWDKSITVEKLLGPIHDAGAMQSNVLLARLMRRTAVRGIGSVVSCARTKTQFLFFTGELPDSCE